MNCPVVVSDAGADLEGVARVAEGAAIELSAEALEALSRGGGAVEALLGSGRAIYGVNTGFGRLATTVVEGDELCRPAAEPSAEPLLWHRTAAFQGAREGHDLPQGGITGQGQKRYQALCCGKSGEACEQRSLSCGPFRVHSALRATWPPWPTCAFH